MAEIDSNHFEEGHPSIIPVKIHENRPGGIVRDIVR